MTLNNKVVLHLQFLPKIVRKECRHLETTDQRLFRFPFTQEQAALLETDPDLAERVEAFVGRFGLSQDTVGDKLLPSLLNAIGEKTGAALDNLDRAERFGFISSVDEWMAMRSLRNQMVHEYVEDLAVLAGALTAGHEFVQSMIDAAGRMLAEIERRGWA